MIRASIDIGSNSCLLLVLEIKGESITTLESHSRITSLGKDLDVNKCFLDESIKSTLQALSDYSNILSKYDIDSREVIVTATEASRVANNFDDLSVPAKKDFNFEIQRISGEGEAFYTAFGVAMGVEDKSSNITIMDIGGASTELINVQLDDFKIINSVSLPIGSVRATNWIKNKAFDVELKKILGEYELDSFKVKRLICVAGTMTTVAAIIEKMSTFNEDKIQGLTFSRESLDLLKAELENKSGDEILEHYPICGKRAFSIYGGALVASKLSSYLNVSEFEISTYGLRYGVAIKGSIDERFI
mgnify:CR=1 FL=1